MRRTDRHAACRAARAATQPEPPAGRCPPPESALSRALTDLIAAQELEAAAANHLDAEASAHVGLARLLAVAHTCYGDNELAAGHARTALEEGGEDAEMHFVLGVEAERRDSEDEALDHYDDAVAADAACWRALFHVGKICLLNGWVADAVDYLERVAAINPGHKPTALFLQRYGSDSEDAGGEEDGEVDGASGGASGAAAQPTIELPTDGSMPEGIGDM